MASLGRHLAGQSEFPVREGSQKRARLLSPNGKDHCRPDARTRFLCWEQVRWAKSTNKGKHLAVMIARGGKQS